MIKSLPAIEKEFSMEEVEKANPGWVRVVLGLFVLIIIMVAVWVDWAHADDTYYRIQKDVRVLAFLGDPGSSRCTTTKYVTAIDQTVRLLHKKSGPGVYAFHLEGLMVKEGSIMSVIKEQGYFLARTKYIKLIKKES